MEVLNRTVTFLCSECHAIAGTVWVVEEESEADLGFPVGVQPVPAESIVIESFLSKGYRTLDPATFREVAEVVRREPVSLADLIRLTHVPFACPDCVAAYCGAHWERIWPVFEADGLYVMTEATCPRGHTSQVNG